jgi:predicted nucleic acid-binding protein
MSGRVFFDTNVLIYVLAKNDPRSKRAEELLAAGGILSVQILNEFVSVARRKLLMSWSEVAEALTAIRILCPSPLPLTVETHEAALKIAERHGYGIYDALVVATALGAGCETLYSEDLHDGQTIDGQVKIRNPFDHSPI